LEEGDSPEEILFKMYEQIKNLNNILADGNKIQKDIKVNLEEMQM
jgi:hypothetical protein